MTERQLCRKHGEVSVWIACRHVGNGSADTIIFSENRDALCFDCGHNFDALTEKDIVGICEECLKDFTAKLMANCRTFANLKNRIQGIEHLKGEWSKP